MTATTQPFTATATNPKVGGPAASLAVYLKNCTGTGPSGAIAANTWVALASGDTVTANRPSERATLLASIIFQSDISGGGSIQIQRTILNQELTFVPTARIEGTYPATGQTNFNTQQGVKYVGTLGAGGSGTIQFQRRITLGNGVPGGWSAWTNLNVGVNDTETITRDEAYITFVDLQVKDGAGVLSDVVTFAVPAGYRVLKPPTHVWGDPVLQPIPHIDPSIPFDGGTGEPKTGEKPESRQGAAGSAGAGGQGGSEESHKRSGSGGYPQPGRRVIADPIVDVSGFVDLIDPLTSQVGATLKAVDGRAGIESAQGASLKGAAGAGLGGSGIAEEGRVRGGSGGMPTPRMHVTADPVVDTSGFLPLIDTDARSVGAALKAIDGKTGIESQSGANIKSAYGAGSGGSGIAEENRVRGGSGGTHIPGGFRVTADPMVDATGFLELIDTGTGRMHATAFKYAGGSAVDGLKPAQANADVTSTHTSADTSLVNGNSAATVGTGGVRAAATIDSGNIVVAAGVDLSRGYAGRNLSNISDDATSDRRAATANQKTGADRGFSALDSSNRLTGGLAGDQNSTGKIFLPAASPPSVGTTGTPATITKTVKIPAALLLPLTNAQVYTETNGYVGPTAASSSASFVGAVILPNGVTITAVRARMGRSKAGETAVAILYKCDDSGVPTALATLTLPIGIGFGTVSGSVSEVVGTYNYVIRVDLTNGTSPGFGASYLWYELDYTTPDFGKTSL
jgi:hypothetical protein